MDAQFQIMQSIILERTKEEIMGLNSNGTKGTIAGRLREHDQRLGFNQMGALRLPQSFPSERGASPLED